MTEVPTIKELAPKQVAFVSFTGNYVGNAEVFKTLFGKLAGWAGPKQLLGTDTVFLSSYQDDPNVTPPENLTLEVCMTIPENTEVEGEIQKKVLPGGQYAVMRAELKSPEEYGPAWMKVVDWMKENKYSVDMSRPSYEIYLNNPEDHPEKLHIVEICMSVIEASSICQSCGMPIRENSMKGTEEDGSANEEYCSYCFKDGAFTFNGSFEEFAEKQVRIAVDMMGMPEEKARAMAKSMLPHLKRWQS